MTLRTPDGAPPESPTHRLAHLSDPHLTAVGTRYNESIDADAALARAVAVLTKGTGLRPIDALVVTGDCTDSGDPDAYRRLAAALTEIAPLIVWVTGNHDVRTTFHAELLGGNSATATGPLLRVYDCAGLRIVALDSTIPGHGHGRLDPGHLNELADVLAVPAPYGTIVALHHAPLPPPSPLLTYFALERRSREALARVVAGTDVRLVLAGHHHLAQSGTVGGVQVAIAGSTAIRTDPLARPGHERTTTSASVNLVDVYPDTAVVSVVPVDDAAEVFDLDEAGCHGVIAEHPADN